MKCDLPTLTPGPVNENRILRPFLIFYFLLFASSKANFDEFQLYTMSVIIDLSKRKWFYSVKIRPENEVPNVCPSSVFRTLGHLIHKVNTSQACLQVASCFLNFCVQIVSVVCNCEGKLKTNIFHIFSKSLKILNHKNMQWELWEQKNPRNVARTRIFVFQVETRIDWWL